MININKVIIQGYIGKKPEIRTTSKGKEVATFDVAVTKTYTKPIKDDRNEDKTKESSTQWIKVVCWNEYLIPKVKDYLKKGTRVYVEGELNTRVYTDNQGREQYTTEVWTKALQFENERGGE